MKIQDCFETWSSSQMLVVLSLVWFSCWTDVVYALPDEPSRPIFVYAGDTRSYKSSNGLQQLSSISSNEDQLLYALGYAQRQQQQQQQPSHVSTGFASVKVVPLGVSNFRYQSLTPSDAEVHGRSEKDSSSNYEAMNAGDDVVLSSKSQHVEENYDSDDDAEADTDNDSAETQAQLYEGGENGGNTRTNLGSTDSNESDTEEEVEEAHVIGKSGRSRRRRRRAERMRPKVIIVKKIVPLSTTTYRYIVRSGR